MITLEKDKNWHWQTKIGGDIEICCPNCGKHYRMDQPVDAEGKVEGFVLCPVIRDTDSPDHCYCTFKGFVNLHNYDGGEMAARHVPDDAPEAKPVPARDPVVTGPIPVHGRGRTAPEVDYTF